MPCMRLFTYRPQKRICASLLGNMLKCRSANHVPGLARKLYVVVFTHELTIAYSTELGSGVS
ncbi:hypothetical protein J6590_031527 [Homalodisca vitripennis]|nr:hypothetical protein J6590_031527 [Homalodisca vitripennis]